LGMPLISTKEHRKYSIPFSWMSAFGSVVNVVPP
jgi:hypothetical protein